MSFSSSQQQATVEAAAKRHGIPTNVLWGIYGEESTWGKGGSNWFGLTSVPRTGSFAGDANRSAETVARLTHEAGGNLNTAIERYSGGSYNLSHVEALAKEHGEKPLEIFGVKQYGLGLPFESTIDKFLGVKLAKGGPKKAAEETVGEIAGSVAPGGLLGGAGELVLKGVLLLVGALLVVAGVLVAVRPPDRALSLPKVAVLPV